MDNKQQPDTALVPTGIAGLDNILGGGLTANRLYLINGDPGAGKTTLGLQFLLAGAEAGESTVYVTLSETQEELAAVAASHGWSLDRVAVVDLAPAEDLLSPDGENTLYHPWELELNEATKNLLARIDEHKPSRVVLDSLSEMRLLAQSSLRYRRQVLALKHFLASRRCTVMLLDDQTYEGSDPHLQSIAHGVVSLERHSPDYGVMQRRLQVLKMRGRPFRTGFHDYVVIRGGLSVFPRLVSAGKAEGFAREQLRSGVTQLDAVMHGGPDRGTSMLLMGSAGTGKSTIASQYAAAAAERGEHVAFFLFDESTRLLLARSAGLGIPLAQHVESGMVTARQVDPGEMTVGHFVHLVQHEVDQKGARLVVIDSLNGYLNAMPETQFLALQLHELLSYLGQRGVTTLLVMAQHGLVGEYMHVPVDASYLADSVVLLRYFEAAGHVRKALAVLKKRGGAHEHTIREFRFGKNGVTVGEPLEEFQGVLTGVPTYIGKQTPLLRGDGA